MVRMASVLGDGVHPCGGLGGWVEVDTDGGRVWLTWTSHKDGHSFYARGTCRCVWLDGKGDVLAVCKVLVTMWQVPKGSDEYREVMGFMSDVLGKAVKAKEKPIAGVKRGLLGWLREKCKKLKNF